MHYDQKLQLLVSLSEEFVQVSNIMNKYRNRTPVHQWDVSKLQEYTRELKTITTEFQKISSATPILKNRIQEPGDK
jgi:hypothetical protein